MTVKQIEKILNTYDPMFKLTEKKNVLRQVLEKFKKVPLYINEEAEISKIANEMSVNYKVIYEKTHNDKYKRYVKYLTECNVRTLSFDDVVDSLNASELKSTGKELVLAASKLFRNIKVDYNTFSEAVKFYELNND